MNNNKTSVGRPTLPAHERKRRVTVSLRPKGDEAWSKFARAARTSKGGLVDWLVRSPEAAECRKLAMKRAHFYVPE